MQGKARRQLPSRPCISDEVRTSSGASQPEARVWAPAAPRLATEGRSDTNSRATAPSAPSVSSALPASNALSARCLLRFWMGNPTRKLLPTGVYSDVCPHGFGVYSDVFGCIRTFGHPGNCARSRSLAHVSRVFGTSAYPYYNINKPECSELSTRRLPRGLRTEGEARSLNPASPLWRARRASAWILEFYLRAAACRAQVHPRHPG